MFAGPHLESPLRISKAFSPLRLIEAVNFVFRKATNLWQVSLLDDIKNSEENSEQVKPPTSLELISVILDDVEQYCQASCPDVQLARVDDARKLEENGKPSSDPDALHSCAIRVVVVDEVRFVIGNVLGAAPDQSEII